MATIETEDWIEEMFGDTEGGSGHILDSIRVLYFHTFQDIIKKIDKKEFQIIVNSMEGKMLTGGKAGEELLLFLTEALAQERISNEIDSKVLLNKVHNMPLFHRACLEWFGYQFWYCFDGKLLDYIDRGINRTDIP